MSTRLRILAATLGGAVLVSGALLGAVAPVAAAGSTGTTTHTGPCATEQAAYKASETVANGIALGGCLITQRLDYLSKATTRVQDSKVLTSADRSALATILANDTSGLTALKSTVDGETSLSAVQADLHAIVSQYRVFRLVARQVALVSQADAVGAAVARYTGTVSPRLEARIQAAAAKGRNTTAAAAALAAMNRAVSAASSDVSGLSARVLALTPAEYDAHHARPVLVRAETAVLRARAQLLDARADALRVVIRLR